jgi:hypothetical protein
VAGVKDPAEGFGKHIRRVNNAWDMRKLNVAKGTPLLKGKIPDINMTGAFSGTLVVDDLEGGVVVLMNGSGDKLRVVELLKHITKVTENFGNGVGTNEFCFSGILSSNGLGLTSVGDSAASDAAAIASGGAALAEVIAMGSVNVADKLVVGDTLGDTGELGVRDDTDIRNRREILVRFGAPIDNTPIDSVPKVDSQMFQGLVVYTGGTSRELG